MLPRHGTTSACNYVLVLAGPSRVPVIVGSVLGGTAAAALLASVLCLMHWSAHSYKFRAYKRSIEDHVHALVLGLSRGELASWAGAGQDSESPTEADNEAMQVRLLRQRCSNYNSVCSSSSWARAPVTTNKSCI